MIPLQPRNQLLNHGPRAVLRALGPFLAIQPSDVGAQDTLSTSRIVSIGVPCSSKSRTKCEAPGRRLSWFQAFVGMVLPEGKCDFGGHHRPAA